MLESLLLPTYGDAQDTASISDRDGRITRPKQVGCSVECICGFSLERLLSHHHAPLLKAHEDAALGNDRGGSDEVFLANKITPIDVPQALTGL